MDQQLANKQTNKQTPICTPNCGTVTTSDKVPQSSKVQQEPQTTHMTRPYGSVLHFIIFTPQQEKNGDVPPLPLRKHYLRKFRGVLFLPDPQFLSLSKLWFVRCDSGFVQIVFDFSQILLGIHLVHGCKKHRLFFQTASQVVTLRMSRQGQSTQARARC